MGLALTIRNAMLELAPEYFKYTQSTYNKATSLVKIVGFFSGMSTPIGARLTYSLYARPKERDKEEHGLASHGELVP